MVRALFRLRAVTHSSAIDLTCDQAFFFRRRAKEKQRETRRSVGCQSGFSQARKKYAWYIYCTSRLPPVQNLDFSLIGRKTKESLTGSFSHIPIGYIIACLTSGAISKQEAVNGDRRGRCEQRIFRCSYYVSWRLNSQILKGWADRMHQKDY